MQQTYPKYIVFGTIDAPFTKSNGTLMSRIYERLTKASRRRGGEPLIRDPEEYYRRGIYDTLKALQDELA